MKLFDIHIHVHHHSESGDTLDLLGELSTKFDNLGKEVHQMAEDLTKLKEAQEANAVAIDNAVTEINDLVAQLANTQPSNQPEIDRITEALNAKTAALAAAAKAPTPAP